MAAVACSSTHRKSRHVPPQRLLLAALAAFSPIARADIYSWTLSDPADPTSQRIPSSDYTWDGLGHSASPYADLPNLELQQAYFIGANLQHANLSNAYLNLADFTSASLKTPASGALISIMQPSPAQISHMPISPASSGPSILPTPT